MRLAGRVALGAAAAAAVVLLATAASLLALFAALLLPYAVRHEPWNVGAALVALGIAAVCVLALAAVAFAFRRRGRLGTFLAAAGAGFALTLTLASAAAIAQTVRSDAHREHVWFGYPVHFVEAELGASPPAYPVELRWNPWEDPAEVHEGRLILSWLLVAAAIVGPPAALRRLRA